MDSQAQSASHGSWIFGNVTLTPTWVALIGLAAALGAPVVALQGVSWILLGAVLVLISFVCDRLYPVAARRKATGRGALVFVPLASRVSEIAWLYGFWQLGVPAEVVVTAGGLSLLHEYVRARGYVAGTRDIGMATLGERGMRTWATMVGYGVAGTVALTSTTMSADLAVGIVTIAATGWLLLAALGLVQLLILVSAALRS